MYPRRSHVSLQNFFAGLAENTFQVRLGVADPPLVDYLATLLSRFVRLDAMFSVRDPSGRRLEEIAQLVAEAQQRVGEPQREVHRHIGDFALFWAGVFPEALKRLCSASRKDHFVDYCAQGKRSYYIASTMRNDENAHECDVLSRLSQEFELCVYGLSEVRREWERRDEEDGDTPGPFLIN